MTELRPSMDVDLFKAAIKGDSVVLEQRLGLPLDQNAIQVIIKPSDESQGVNAEHQTHHCCSFLDSCCQVIGGAKHETYPSEQSERADAEQPTDPNDPNDESPITEAEHQTRQSDLISSTTRLGDTLLHLLITENSERHNRLALKVFLKDTSLLKAQNNKKETPLHCAAKVGNDEIIRDLHQHQSEIVRETLREKNGNGDTALHVATSHDKQNVVRELMKLDRELACIENSQGFSPLYMAIVKGSTSAAKAMLVKDTTLVCTQFYDGMFPVHIAARIGNINLLLHLLGEYPDSAALLDPCRRNFFHIAAEQMKTEVITEAFDKLKQANSGGGEMARRMINARDFEGNTPLHIAAMKGHRYVMKSIWKKLDVGQRAVKNQEGQTAFDISLVQLKNTSEVLDKKIKSYVEEEGSHFTKEWFEGIMEPQKNEQERIQVTGLGSIFIVTATFAAAFAVPGGYNPNDGTPLLGKRYIFKAFVFANASAFILSLTSIFVLLSKYFQGNARLVDFKLASMLSFSAGNCMIAAFGLGSYVMLASITLPVAVVVLSGALLFATPFQFVFVLIARKLWKWGNLNSVTGMFVVYALPMLSIFITAIICKLIE